MSTKISIKSDTLTRRLYAQDASMYEEMPKGVIFPESGEDIAFLVRQAAKEKWSITARSAGTSLAGQATGSGLIMDVSKNMNRILELNVKDSWVKVQPGVIRDQLNREVALNNLIFGPDTSTTSHCMIGGMIGNNAAGLYSYKYGSTSNNMIEMEVVLTDGTRIVGGVRSKNAINIWTDNSLWLMQFTGPPFTFSFRQAGSNCGMIAAHAGVDYNGVSYWMGDENFYAYDGQVKTLPCTVRRFIFDDLNYDVKDKVFAGINSEFKEIIWLYPGNDSEECNKYVVHSPEENYWVYGTGLFTTFADRTVFGNTITTGVTAGGNNLYNNEPAGVFTENGQPQSSFIESADFDMADGNEIMFLSRVIPDFTLNDGALTFSIKTKDFPESPSEREKPQPPHTITNSTVKIDMRARGRQGRVRVSCNAAGTSWKWGSIRLAIQPDGRR